MTMQDPIADMLTRIRNAQMARKNQVVIPYSKQKEHVIKVILAEGYIADYEITGEGTAKQITVSLKYFDNSPVITAIKRISRPGLRIYKNCQDLPKVVGGLGVAIISTSKGVMSDKAARYAKVGGEVLCYIW